MALFPPAVPALPPLVPFTQDQILALFDRILPDHYLAPLKDPGPGYEYLQAVAKMIERVSIAIAHVGSGCFIGSSDSGSYAQGAVELYRDTDEFGAVTLLGRNDAPQGTLVGTETGYYYQLIESVSYAEGEIGPKLVYVRAVTRGWLWNVPESFITADGELVEGPINRMVRPVFPLVGTSPFYPNFDPTIKVRQRCWGYAKFYRPTAAAGAATLKAGTLLTGTWFGAEVTFKTIDDAFFAAASTGPVTVRYIPLNGAVFGQYATTISAPLWGSDSAIDNSIAIDYSDPDYVIPLTAPFGGSAPMLDGIGADKGIPRNFSGIRSVQLVRDGTNPIMVMPDTVLATSDGFRYATTTIVNFAADEFGPKSVSVVPLFLNEPANTLPVSQVIEDKVVWGTDQQDSTLTIALGGSPTPTTELDIDYKARLTFLPATITPNALRKTIAATLDNVLSPLGKTWGYREVWDLRYQTAYDCPRIRYVPTYLDNANLNVPVPPFNSAVFVYDYVPLNEALSNRYLSANPERGVVVVRLPALTPPEDMASIYPGLAANLEKIKPAGTAVLYVLGDQ